MAPCCAMDDGDTLLLYLWSCYAQSYLLFNTYRDLYNVRCGLPPKYKAISYIFELSNQQVLLLTHANCEPFETSNVVMGKHLHAI